MKKKLILGGAVALLVTIAAYAAENVYKCQQDSCGKCTVTQYNKQCGKDGCGGWLESQGEKNVPGTHDVEAWFKCKKCGHQSKWRW